jgi:hypothetical protein
MPEKDAEILRPGAGLPGLSEREPQRLSSQEMSGRLAEQLAATNPKAIPGYEEAGLARTLDGLPDVQVDPVGEASPSTRMSEEAWRDAAEAARAGGAGRRLHARMSGGKRSRPAVAGPANPREREDRGLI